MSTHQNTDSSTKPLSVDPDVDLFEDASRRAGLHEDAIHQLAGWLAKQLEKDRFTRLERAGHAVEDRIPLARVFVDLEVSRHPSSETSDIQGPKQFFARLLNEGRHCDEQTFDTTEESAGEPRPLRERGIVGFALVGGPGQGKSTLGQLLCQQHRAWLLRPRISQLSDHEERNAVETFSGPQATSELSKPSAIRFPIRITLSDAAAWLAIQSESSAADTTPDLLQHYIEHEKCPISASCLFRLLVEIDWLLVLDGLDEVPASSNRERLLDSVRRLIERLSRDARHGVILATTRPQGYSGEFDKLGLKIDFCQLTPLSKERAKIYSERLIQTRFPLDRQQIVLHRLEQAAEGDATARLMSTPLQITILATLVDRIGRAPSEQWTLFREYYRVIYEREMERPFETAELLRLYRSHIDKIHAHVGLLLQVEAEDSGGTDSTLSPSRFAQVVDAVLTEDDIEGSRRRELVNKLGRAVRDRLVLLVELRPERLGFEIRSIQEFMAAWAISQKNEDIVQTRLTQIAKAASFRRVVLFLASKSFTELSDLRDVFTEQLCPSLNDTPDNPLAQEALLGSVLALEILDEGSGLKQTKYVRKLSNLATRLVELPPNPIHHRLAKACLFDNDAKLTAMPILASAIKKQLTTNTPEKQLGAWATLLPLIDAGEAWAESIANQHWESHAESRNNILHVVHRFRIPAGNWLVEKLKDSLGLISPYTLDIPFSRIDRKLIDNFRQLRALRTLLRPSQTIRIKFTIEAKKTSLSGRLTPIFPGGEMSDWAELINTANPSPEWLPLIATARFIVNPNAKTLSSALKEMANAIETHVPFRLSSHAPWPLAACLGSTSNAEELHILSQRAAKQELGDIADWRVTEKTWKEHPSIDFNDMLNSPGSTWPEVGQLHEGAPPVFAVTFSTHSPIDIVDHKWISSLKDAVIRMPLHQSRTRLLDLLLQTTSNALDEIALPILSISSAEFRTIWSSTTGYLPIQAVAALQPWNTTDNEWPELLDEIGRSDRVYSQDEPECEELSQYLSRLYIQDPSRTGILHILALLIETGTKTDVPTELLTNKHLSRDSHDDAALLLLARGALPQDDAVNLATRLAQQSKTKFWTIHQLLDILNRTTDDSALRDSALLALKSNIPPGEWGLAATLANSISAALRHRKSGLGDLSVWDHLRLPLPRPERGRTAEIGPSAERRPVWIESIHIQNIRNFNEIRISLIDPTKSSTRLSSSITADAGQWVAILGENGLGKSTLLRSLVFGLVDVTSQPGRLPRSTLDAPWRRQGTNEQAPATISVQVLGESYRAEVKSDPNHSGGAERLEQSPPFLPYPVFAYGCRRGSALGGASRRVDDDPGAELPTLFDEGADLIHAETWLLLRENAALKEEKEPGGARQLYDEILKALCELLPGIDTLEGRRDRVWIRGKRVGEVSLAGLSDGYLTTLGWVVDLIARWIRRTELRNDPIPRDFTKAMTGLVLIDEIDLHLHPEWQLQIISNLRRVFPRLSFIVTTHNPMTLIGLTESEIWRLSNEDGKIVAKQGRERPALMTGSDIYDAYFGIRSIFPSDLGSMLDRYNLLARDPVRSDDDELELQTLHSALRERGIEPEWKAIQREPIDPHPGDAQT